MNTENRKDIPLVSIVIPVYNGSNYLKQAIESALRQTYNNIEVIVVNDGSNDNGATDKIANSFGSKIRYYYKPNGGVASALNFALQKMNGIYFSWLSHDDLYHPEKIEKQVLKILSVSDEKAIISCNTQLINHNGDFIRAKSKLTEKSIPNNKLFARLHKKNLDGCALLIKKDMLLQIKGFNEEYKYIQDFDAWVRLSFLGANIYFNEEALTYKRIHHEQGAVVIRHRHIIEVKEYSLAYFNGPNRNYERDQIVLKRAITFGCWNDVKSPYYSAYKRTLAKVVGINYLRLKAWFVRILKKIYWKVKRK